MSDRQRTGARSVLVSVVTLFFILAALQGLAVIRAGGWSALAQTGTPSPGQTTSAPPKIAFLNPSDDTSTVVNDGQDADTAYHINTWVQSVPATPTVEFQLIDADPATTTPIGTGTQRGADAFDLFWNVPDNLADGAYTLKAILKSNGVEVANAEQDIVVNHEDGDLPSIPDPEDPASSIEIDDPNNGGPLGIYTTPGDSPTKSFVVAYTASADVTSFVAYYSLTPPGTAPEWTECGGEAPDGPANPNGTQPGRVRCELADTDTPTQVRAVALVPSSNPTPLPVEDQFLGAADAHRVVAYNQDATTVSVTPETQNVTDLGKCALLTATVLDQSGEIIAGHNVDVHAAGPSDNLNFDTGGEFSDASQAPDQGEHGTAEEATECDADGVPTAGGTQGEHDDPASNNDRKHIESVDDTDDEGTFDFALSTDIAGITQVTAWADEDGDDQFCATEAFDPASIGWQQTPPAPTALPFDEQTCSASPSPTGTSTGSPTGTGTGPTPDRTVTLAASKNKVVAGKTVTLSGQVTAAETSCEDNELVEIHRRIHGKQNFQPFAEDATDANGAFQTSILVKKSADYMAVLNAHDDCSAATSNDETVLAKVKLFLAVEDKSVNRGDTVRIKVAIRPQHDGDRVILQVKKGKRWVKFDVDKANKRSIAKFRFPANWNGTKVFRAKWPKQHPDHEVGKSRRAEIRTN